jgi:MvaI/BcnI restriction endonuclease family
MAIGDELLLDQLKDMMASKGARRLLVKELAPNDNSKNQPYVAKDQFSAFNIFTVRQIETGTSDKGNSILKANLDFYWIKPDGGLQRAPHCKLIFYPQYPEMRLSGFLKGAKEAPSSLMNQRIPKRLLFLGLTDDGRTIAWVAGPTSRIAVELSVERNLEELGVFRIVPLGKEFGKEKLISELRRVHQAGWIKSKSLNGKGVLVACEAGHCVGYTLEAELGISRNGRNEPDFHGWEVKASEVSSFEKPPTSKAITLMTPNPDGGYYAAHGLEKFVRKFGYGDRRGKLDRLNFGGVHRVDEIHKLTGLKLTLQGFDKHSGEVKSAAGSLLLLDAKDNVAAEWSFKRLLEIWNGKHALAAYVPAMVRIDPYRSYKYGYSIRLAVGTDFSLFIRALASGAVYLDPGMKVEGASSKKITTKSRSQFRISSSKLDILYAKITETSLLT